jgi:hypothetical protein
MNRKELIYNLKLLGINPKQYSLFGDLIPDTIVLFQNYHRWEVFYLDERGNRDNEKIFNSENDACLYIYKIFHNSKDIEEKFSIQT